MKLSVALFASILIPAANAAEDCPLVWKCDKTTSSPTLDADLSEWDSVQGIETALQMPISNAVYDHKATYKCLYDDTNIYFALDIPGLYRFNDTDNHFAASIATMMKIGVDATYWDMGGCPEAVVDGVVCTADLVEACDAHRVDIGAHWELKTTQQGVKYPVEDASPARQEAAGNDLIANLDDEYSVGSYCRNDDDDADAGNEWSGAWKHTNPVTGEMGSYIFELSRSLKTPSTKTDGQMEPGETYEFGIAFWDPFETEEEGWTDAGHYVTGCTQSWIEMELVAAGESTTSDAATSHVILSTLLFAMAAAIFAVI